MCNFLYYLEQEIKPSMLNGTNEVLTTNVVFTQEKSKQREEELKLEMERIQQEIRVLQKSSEDSANVSDKLNKEVMGIQLKIQLSVA
jgi:hypothetical protein